MNILIVDDYAPTLESLKQIVSRAFPYYAIDEATTGREAVQRVVAGGVDAVILDITLPDLSGAEVLRQIKRHEPDMPIIVLAVDADPAYAPAVRKAGASGYLAKAAAPDDLVNAIQVALQGGTFFPTV
jgi:two-component system invasion response regulator UvrY